MAARSLSPVTAEALQLLGRAVRVGRIERGWTVDELAERAGLSHVTVRNIERGTPGVAVGSAFEAAVLVGVPLFDVDPERRSLEARHQADRLAVLPRVVRPPQLDDRF